ncbi:MAG: S8 family serine peptidase [Deltaproteobacteria bacterium]|nr:S8 family serine peptidase [Deltaproteobacteria bacterium]
MIARVLALATALCAGLPWAASAGDCPRCGPALARIAIQRPLSRKLRLVTIWQRLPEAWPAGTEPVACLGRVCALRLDSERLEALLAMPALVQADLPGRFRLRLDQARSWLRLPEAQARFPGRGAGVLVAVIDSGLDWRHADFRDDEGRSRVVCLLDQTLPPAGIWPDLERLGDGAVFCTDELQAELDGQAGPAADAGRDVLGHGTHVAGIAAGDDPVYTGVAPEAGLLIVKTVGPDGRADEDRVLAALAFVREIARQRAQPLVVNLSLGDQLGAHDGTEPVELAIDALAGSDDPPCAVVVAAGNEGQLDLHAQAELSPWAGPISFDMLLPVSEPSGWFTVDLWHEAEGPVAIWLRGPSGASSSPVLSLASEVVQRELTPDGEIETLIWSEPRPQNGLGRASLTVTAPQEGAWSISLFGTSSRVDAWIGDWELAGPRPSFTSHRDPSCLVGPPATSRAALAVGAFGFRSGWTDLEGRQHRLQALPGARSAFSSPGPSRDGRIKPDLLAPGQSVFASLSADCDPFQAGSMFYAGGSAALIAPDGRHALGSGTSMAAPFAAGLCALVLEKDPSLRGTEVRAILAACAQHMIAQDRGCGHGRLDALAPVCVLDGEWGRYLDPDRSLCATSRSWLPPGSAQGAQLAAVPRDGHGIPLGPGLAIAARSAEPAYAGRIGDSGDGLYARWLYCPEGSPPQVEIRCELDGEPFGARPVMRAARSHADAFAEQQTGCSHAHRSGGAWLLLLASAGLLGSRRGTGRAGP